jgi:hypothetical protein
VTEELMADGSKCVDKFPLTDDELRAALTTTKLALAYSQARGLSFWLVTTQLRREVETLEGYVAARKAKR